MTECCAPSHPGVLVDGDLELKFAGFTPHAVHRVPAYHFRMVYAFTGEELGAINLRLGHTPQIEQYAGHVGYGVHEAHRGHRYAARSLRLLLPFAARLGLDPLWITCDPENLASRRSLEIAGAQFVEVVDVPEDSELFRSGHPRKCRYRLAVA
jgi:tagatose 1,6-diphosphate aldolase